MSAFLCVFLNLSSQTQTLTKFVWSITSQLNEEKVFFQIAQKDS